MKSHALFAFKVLAVMTIANQIGPVQSIVSGGNKFFK